MILIWKNVTKNMQMRVWWELNTWNISMEKMTHNKLTLLQHMLVQFSTETNPWGVFKCCDVLRYKQGRRVKTVLCCSLIWKKKKKKSCRLKTASSQFHFSLPWFSHSPKQEEVRPQDTVSVIGGVAGSSKQGRKAAWKFVKENWEQLFSRYQGGFLISRLVKVDRCLLGWVDRQVARWKSQFSVLIFFFALWHIFFVFTAHSRRVCYWQDGSWSEGETLKRLDLYSILHKNGSLP